MILWIFLDKIIARAPAILHFKGLGVRNLQYWIRICQKSHNTVTNQNYILFVVRIFMNQTLNYCSLIWIQLLHFNLIFQVLHQDLIVFWCQAMLCLILWQIWYTTALTPWKTLSESALKVDDTLCIKVRKISIVCINFWSLFKK